MSVPYPIPVTAAQVGTYFVAQYYQVLQQQPDYVHQFYSDLSTMLRVDGTKRETAASMLQIHALIMSLNYTGIEIRTAHSLESWNGGVLVMVSGSMHAKDFSGIRKFVETFFLAPQEKGYFVLNDVFHFIEEDSIHHHQAVLLAQSNLDSKFSAPIPEQVPSYMLGSEIQTRDFVAPVDAKENGPVDSYSFPEQRLQQIPDCEKVLEESPAQESDSSLQNAATTPQDHLPAAVEEPAAEPQKHTYASILRVAKGKPAPSPSSQTSQTTSASRNEPSALEWDHIPQTSNEESGAMINSFGSFRVDTVEEVPEMEDEDEIRSVYVRNLLPTTSEAEIEEQFKYFGKIAPNGVVIRSRKDVGVCYAFVEFEDMSGVHNAVKAGSALVAGRQLYIEERRPNSNIPSRAGRGRGRGRGSYQADVPRGRFASRNFGRGVAYDGNEREYNRPRGNGFYRPSARQDRGYSVQQDSRSGQSPSD